MDRCHGGILILGAGGHAKVVADILQSQGHNVTGFLDDNCAIWNTYLLELPVLGSIARVFDFECDGLVLGIGSNKCRQEIVKRLGSRADHLWINAIHPSAVIAASAKLGYGVVVVANAVINPGAIVGDHVIINTAATIDHDCRIGDFSHVAPGAHLCGGTEIGYGVLLGVGTNTVPNARVGNWSTIGAGSTVIHDIPENVIAMGTPAFCKGRENANLNVFS